MNPKVEEALRKSMAAIGRAVDSVIGHAKKAKVSMAPSHSVKPILALESQLSIPKLKELISMSIDRIVPSLIPNLVDKSALELVEGATHFSKPLKDKGAALAIHVDIGGGAGSYPAEARSGAHSVRALVKSVPFEDGFFDFALANLATPYQGDIVKAVKEVGRVVTLGGQSVIIDYHPFGSFAKKGSSRLRSLESTIRGVEDYYKICKQSGFVVSYVRETFFDETIRTGFVTPEEKAVFRGMKDTPFLLFLFVIKKGR